MTKTLVSALGHMRFLQWQRGSASQPYIAQFSADEPLTTASAVAGNATAAFVTWTAGQTGAATPYTVRLPSRFAGGTAVVVRLVDNSTNGLQSAVAVSSSGAIKVEV